MLAMAESGAEDISRGVRRRRRTRLRVRRFRARQKRAMRYAKRYTDEAETGSKPIEGYGDLVAYMTARRKAQGWSQLELDERAGFHTGYTGKLECWPASHSRVAGSVSMALWMQALGVKLVPLAEG